MISKEEFNNRIKRLPKIILSKTGKAAYTGFRIEADTLYFHRVAPKTNWDLNLKVLYRIYISNNFINTSIVKKETGGRVNSPSIAILMAIGCIDNKGNRIK